MKTTDRTLPFLAFVFTLVVLSACRTIDDQPLPPSTGPDARSAFTGTYLMRDSSWFNGAPVTPPYVYYILAVTTGGTRADTLYFNYLTNGNANYYAILSGSNFTFPPQTANVNYTLNGDGSFTDSTVYYQTLIGGAYSRGRGTRQ